MVSLHVCCNCKLHATPEIWVESNALKAAVLQREKDDLLQKLQEVPHWPRQWPRHGRCFPGTDLMDLTPDGPFPQGTETQQRLRYDLENEKARSRADLRVSILVNASTRSKQHKTCNEIRYVQDKSVYVFSWVY